MNPSEMLKLIFSSEPDDDEKDENGEKDPLASHFDNYSDLHGKDINVMHLVCQEGLSRTLEYILTHHPD